MSDPRAAARAIDAVRRGWPVAITGADGTISVLAVETADDPRLTAFDPDGTADVLLSDERAAVLKLANQRDAATPGAPVMVARVPWLDLPAAVALADPAHDLATPLKGPYRTCPVVAVCAASAALSLARNAGLLPTFFVRSDGPAEAHVTADDIAGYARQMGLAIAARAHLPVAGAEQAEIVAFRAPADAAEHVALVIGAPDGNPPLVRLHSECLTGDVLGSLKCDCGPQLHAAIAAIAASGWGILLYLRQEGRGIGLVNKLRAYSLQDQGYDTVESNLRLGFAIDARDFSIAAAMLRLLGQERVRLLTNNPNKVAGLEAAGVSVVERVPHALPPNPHNAHYLAVKRDRTGHLL
ncbi:GTP cyclohydrolase II [uncultured Sphingomonas sp.]|uniref:GTP cyclohydrolase II n=1 Tax=uncultured Sphingomonas sp. TaxID=158754 RepID=UPI0025E495DA|nr:GTP cyclohydrolase II [uncultured Sphingomonas sp.]